MERTRVIAILALVLGTSLVGALVGGCGSDGASSSASGEPAFTSVVYATGFTPYGALDPAEEVNVQLTHCNVYETLTNYDAKADEVLPGLATSWESSPDGLSWTFHLRQGVKFHDGTVFDAEAVKFSIERNHELGLGVAYIWDPISKITTPDANTVVFELSSPAPIDLIASSSFQAYIFSPTAVERYGEKCFQPGYDAGSGPYTLKSATLTEATLERFPDYWGGWDGSHAAAPKVGVIRQITEPAVKVQNLEQGAVQIIDDVPPAVMKGLEGNPDINVWSQPSFVQQIFYFNTKKTPTDDAAFREALYYAFPYDEAISLALGGGGAVSRGYIPQGMLGWDELAAQSPAPKQDMDRARAALARSAYPDGGVKLTCMVDNAYDSLLKSSQLFKTALAELNIDLDIRGMDVNVILEQAGSDNPPQHVYVDVAWPSYVTPLDVPVLVYAKGGYYNFSYWSDPKVDSLLTEAGSLMATDRAGAVQNLVDAWGIILPSYSMIWPADLQSAPSSAASLEGFEGFSPAYPNSVFFYELGQ